MTGKNINVIKACECPNCGKLCEDDGVAVNFTKEGVIVLLNSFNYCQWHCEKCGINFGVYKIEDKIEELL